MDKIEQRIEQIEKFASQCYENGEKYSAFIAGAIWADNNPPQDIFNLNDVWHPASEIPTAKETVLLVQEDGRIFVIEYGCQAIYKRNASWEKVFQMYQPTKWAYISDLLPKGGNDED